MTSAPAAIAVDWGTSRLRAMLLDAGGAVLDNAESGDGIATVKPGGHEAAFAALVAAWPALPAIMAGMIGSRQGWREADYVPCPATPEAIAARLLRFTTEAGRPVAIVPGLVVTSPDRDADVMRGEETQLAGLIAAGGSDGIVILPGTHSKWARLAGGSVASFQTFLTGEMFELLARHSFLRHSVADDGRDLAADPGFALAVRRVGAGGLPFLSAVFSVRTRYLVGSVAPADNLAYLSGLVIGGEIAAAEASGLLADGAAIRIVGSRSLGRAYRAAFAILGRAAETIDGGDMVRAGLVAFARRIGFLKGENTR